MSVSDCIAVISRVLPEPHAGLLSGMLFGTNATLSKDLHQALIATGTLHIVALLGFNITILIQLASLVLLLFMPRIPAYICTIGLIVGFVLFVGPSPPVVRAAIMGSMALLAVVFGRQAWSLLSLILASLIMVILSPSWLTNISFQLSVAATLGIILFASGKKEHESSRGSDTACPANTESDQLISPEGSGTVSLAVRRAWCAVRQDVRLTLAAQVFTTPIILHSFHRASLISPLSNVLIGFVIPPLTAFGLAVVVLGLVWFPLGLISAWFAWVPLEYIIRVVLFTGSLPGASFSF